MGGYLAPSLGGRKIISRNKFSNDFLGNKFCFDAENSDDLF